MCDFGPKVFSKTNLSNGEVLEMTEQEWIYILIAVAFLLFMLLIFLIKKFTRSSHEDVASTSEQKETPRRPSFSGVNNRENFRVALDDVNCFVEFLDVDNDNLNPKFFNGVLKNISVGGVKFVCDYEYPIEEELEIKVRFSLNDSRFILKGIIVRKELYPERNRFGYGVKFTNLFDEDRELLYRLLNRIMVEKRKEKVSSKLVGEESMV